jgi:hypothetical protein
MLHHTIEIKFQWARHHVLGLVQLKGIMMGGSIKKVCEAATSTEVDEGKCGG